MTRNKTSYPGVFYRETERIGGPGIEKVYYIVFKKDGKVLEEKVGRQYVDDLTPARAAHIRAERIEGKRLSRREIRQEEDERRKALASRWTTGRLWEEYRDQKGQYKTLRTDKTNYRHIEPFFASKEPKEIIQLDIDRLRLRLTKTLKPQTVKHVLTLLKRVINFGVRKGLCEGLSFTIEMPKVHNLKTEDLNPEQLERLLQAIDESENIQAAHMMKMVLFTGMRRGEMFRLRWDDISFDRGFIHLCDPKGGPDQKIPLNEPARELLENHPRTDGSSYVFPGRAGGQRVDIKKQVNRIKERAGIPKEFRALHGLRHVYASMLASSGQVDMYTLQKLLTHKSPVMTQRYAHLRDETLKRASELAGTLVAKVAEEGKQKPSMKLA